MGKSAAAGSSRAVREEARREPPSERLREAEDEHLPPERACRAPPRPRGASCPIPPRPGRGRARSRGAVEDAELDGVELGGGRSAPCTFKWNTCRPAPRFQPTLNGAGPRESHARSGLHRTSMLDVLRRGHRGDELRHRGPLLGGGSRAGGDPRRGADPGVPRLRRLLVAVPRRRAGRPWTTCSAPGRGRALDERAETTLGRRRSSSRGRP
jgi:hypothetical protein